MWIIVSEGKEKEKQTEIWLKEMLTETFPYLEKDVGTQIYKAQRATSSVNWDVSQHIIIK
jgi:hypothetical protein